MKKDPTKTRFQIEGFRKGQLYCFADLRDPVITLGILEGHIRAIGLQLEEFQHQRFQDSAAHAKPLYDSMIRHLEQALDYLFAELGRRAARKVLK